MRSLIGHTGFVGTNLKAQQSFDALYNSKNIETICGRDFDEIYCAGAPGLKWLANSEPQADRISIQRLIQQLKQVTTRKMVLISTVDVYGDVASGKNEWDFCDISSQSAYGRHRWELEQFVQDNFDHLIVRLPLLFGRGLKKNILYDLIHRQRLEQVNRQHCLQWYNLSELSRDIETALKRNIRVINLVSAPLNVEDMLGQFFENGLGRNDAEHAIRYDVRTEYSLSDTPKDFYTHSRDKLLTQMEYFIKSHFESST